MQGVCRVHRGVHGTSFYVCLKVVVKNSPAGCVRCTRPLFSVFYLQKHPTHPGRTRRSQGVQGVPEGVHRCASAPSCACVSGAPLPGTHLVHPPVAEREDGGGCPVCDMSRVTPKPRRKAATMCVRTVQSGCAKNRGTERAFGTPDVHTNVHTTLV